MKWYQLFVQGAGGNVTPQAMKRIDEHIQMYGAHFSVSCPGGLPDQEDDGTFGVKVHAEGLLSVVKRVLTEAYDLVIVREEEHDPDKEFAA